MLLLYDHPVSSYAQKIRIALREKGIPFEAQVPPGLGRGQPVEGLAEANPRNEVPALVDGAIKLFDSKVILAYLEDKYPDPNLLPASPENRAEARMIEEVCDAQWEAVNWGVSEVQWQRRATGELAAKLLAAAERHWNVLFAWLAEKLGSKDYLTGDGMRFGYADVCAIPVFHRTVYYGHGPPEGSTLQAWYRRVQQRESVRLTLHEMEGGARLMQEIGKGSNPFRPGGGARREYRDHRLEWMVKSGAIDVVSNGIKNDTIRFSWPCGI